MNGKNPADAIALTAVADQFQRWVDWDTKRNCFLGIPPDETHIGPFPEKLTRGVVKQWIALLRREADMHWKLVHACNELLDSIHDLTSFADEIDAVVMARELTHPETQD